MKERAVITWKSILLFVLIIISALILLAFFIFSSPADMLVINSPEKSERVKFLPSLEGETMYIKGESDIEIELELGAKSVRVASSTCPDKTCMKTGEISRQGESIICLPAKISIRLDGRSHLDAETY